VYLSCLMGILLSLFTTFRISYPRSHVQSPQLRDERLTLEQHLVRFCSVLDATRASTWSMTTSIFVHASSTASILYSPPDPK
jgi:hypothetical protein